MRRYEKERQLKAWARNFRDAVLLTGLGAVLIAASVGAYFFLTNLLYYVNFQQSYGLISGSAMFMGFLVFVGWLMWYAIDDKKARPLLVGLDVSAMIVANLFFGGFWADVGTAIGIVLLFPIVMLIDKIRNLYSEETPSIAIRSSS